MKRHSSAARLGRSGDRSARQTAIQYADAFAESYKRQASALRKQLARTEAELSTMKAATAGNECSPGFEVMLKLLAMACKRKPVNAQLAIRESDVWRNGVASASAVSDEQMKRIAAALAGNLI